MEEDDSGICKACDSLRTLASDFLKTTKTNIRERRGSVTRLGLSGASGKQLQVAWNTRLDTIVSALFKSSLEMIVKDSSEKGWCFCVSGSGARQEACPYSDLDCFILVENDGPSQVDVFRRAAKQMSDILFAIDEDGTLDLGIRFCHGGLNPLGYNTESQPELIGSPGQIASLIEHSAVNEHIRTGLGESRGLCGDEKLHDAYRLEVESVRGKSLWAPLGRPLLAGHKKQAMKLLEKAASAWKGGLDKNTKEVDIKLDVYRIPQYALGGLAMYYGVNEQNSFKIVEALQTRAKLSHRAVVAFKEVLEVSAKMRISAHLVQGGEVDALVNKPQKNATELNDEEWKTLLNCRYQLEFIARVSRQFCENKRSALKMNRSNPFVDSI